MSRVYFVRPVLYRRPRASLTLEQPPRSPCTALPPQQSNSVVGKRSFDKSNTLEDGAGFFMI